MRGEKSSKIVGNVRSKISKEGEFVVTAAIDDGDYVESDGESDRDISSDEEPEEDADEDEEDPNSTSSEDSNSTSSEDSDSTSSS